MIGKLEEKKLHTAGQKYLSYQVKSLREKNDEKKGSVMKQTFK